MSALDADSQTKIPRPPYSSVVVYGAGVMGTSLAMALQARGVAREVELIDPDPETRNDAAALGLTVRADPPSLKGSAEAVFLAAPPSANEMLLAEVARLYPGALVTDLGSVKRSIQERALELRGSNASFLFAGSHPICGSEQSGARAAFADLFLNQSVAICAVPDTPPAVLASLERTWQLLGSRPVFLSAEEHDRWIALTSHLPMMVASSLSSTSATAMQGNSVAELLIGPGYRDTTRVAASSPMLWLEILERNADQIGPVLRNLIDDLKRLDQSIDDWGKIDREDVAARRETAEKIRRWLDSASKYRHRFVGE